MNLSKLVAQDVPLFLSVLGDLFPTIPPPPKGNYDEVEAILKEKVAEKGFIYHQAPGVMVPGWGLAPPPGVMVLPHPLWSCGPVVGRDSVCLLRSLRGFGLLRAASAPSWC